MQSSTQRRFPSRFSTWAPLCSEETEMEEEEEGSMPWSMLCGSHVELALTITFVVVQSVMELVKVAVAVAAWLVFATLKQLVLSSPSF